MQAEKPTEIRKEETEEIPPSEQLTSETGGPTEQDTKVYSVLGTKFNIDKKFEVLDVVGSGAYGVVTAAKDIAAEEFVAIKKIEKSFEHPIFALRTLRELKINRLLNHDNIIKLRTI